MSPRPDRSPLVPLAPMRPEAARRFLSPPFTPAMLGPSLAAACRARPLAVPVHLVLPTTALGPRFARALHALTGPHGDLLIATDERPELRALPLSATVVLDPTRLDPTASLALEGLLDDGDAWVIAISDGTGELSASLAARLAAVAITVPALARRQLEMPALSTAVLQTMAARAGRPAPALAPAARTRLAMHPWPGDLLELEAVLGRALASGESGTLEVDDLGLDPAAVIAPQVVAAAPPSAPPPPPTDERLEALLAELAHEILNPLSTVKMMLGHLPQLLADAEARDALSGRADEAIGRVDALLQNVLEYARLGAPARAPVSVGPLLDRLLAEAAPELAERAVRVRRAGEGDVTCVADAAQLEYGFRNLLSGVVREVPPRDEVVIETSQNGVVKVRFAAGDAAAARLRAMVREDGVADLADPTVLPLSFTLARAVLERNGGALSVQDDPDDGPTTLVVRLPTLTPT